MSPFRINCSVKYLISHKVVNSLLPNTYKINPSLCSACFLLCSSQVSQLQCELERVQKRHCIICPSLSSDEALNEADIPTIISYCEDICDKVSNVALGNKDNKLNKLLTQASKVPYSLRKHRHFALLKWKTDSFKNTFGPF